MIIIAYRFSKSGWHGNYNELWAQGSDPRMFELSGRQRQRQRQRRIQRQINRKTETDRKANRGTDTQTDRQRERERERKRERERERQTYSDFRYNGYGPDADGQTWKHQKMRFEMSKKSRKFTCRSCHCCNSCVGVGHYGITLVLLSNPPPPPSIGGMFETIMTSTQALRSLLSALEERDSMDWYCRPEIQEHVPSRIVTSSDPI